MLTNHSYLPHRYSIRFALFLMTLDTTRVHAGGGARGQNLGHLIFFFFFLRMTFGPDSQCPRLCPRFGIHVSSVYRSK